MVSRIMEGVPGTDKASILVSEDVISSMPDSVITNIMNLLPIRVAVRTSILSRNWRLKWTLLTRLVFNDQIPGSLSLGGKRYANSRIISSLLFLLTGPVTEFVLWITDEQILDAKDFNHWVLFLSRKGIKKFTFINDKKTPFKLHTHLFSCLELTHLTLVGCCVHLPPTFSSFPNLLSLQLRKVYFESGTFEGFITRCPLLQIMDIDSYPRFNYNLDDITNLVNLEKFFLRRHELEKAVITTSRIFQLLDCFPKLEELYLNFRRRKDADEFYVPPTELFSSDLGSNTVGQLQLQDVVIKRFSGSENEE